MKQSSTACVEVPAPESRERLRSEDPRWHLAQAVVASRYFARSPLLSRFLLHVVGETIEGRHELLTEHRIGVAVFSRPVSYRTDEDNIVRNYARQLRRRLHDHFATEGSASPLRIEIPVGGYIPVFCRSETRISAGPEPVGEIRRAPVRNRGRWASGIALMILVLVLLLSSVVLYRANRFVAQGAKDPVRDFWSIFISRDPVTYIVPSDAGFNVVEDMAQHAMPLASYIRGSYDGVPWNKVSSHAAQDLRTQQYTDLVSLQIVAWLASRPEYNPQRVLLRFPRELRLDDLKHANALIIGSVSANPWASLVDAGTNFHVVLSGDMKSAVIVNNHPQQGEQGIYVSHWNEPAHETFGLIEFAPNLSGSGRLLLIEGLDVAGTEAAAELLFDSESIAPMLRRAQRKDGTFRPFEILVRATSIQSNAEHVQILATRIL